MRRSIPILTEQGLPDAPALARKGRGTPLAIAHRFESEARARADDGWPGDADAEADTQADAAPRTEVREQRVRSLLSRNDSPDIPFAVALNPYRGCEHVMRQCKLFKGGGPTGSSGTVIVAARPLPGNALPVGPRSGRLNAGLSPAAASLATNARRGG